MTESKSPRKKNKIAAGDVFGHFTVMDLISKTINGKSLAKCRCICGAVVEVKRAALFSGNTKSCGCQQYASLIARNKARKGALKYPPIERVCKNCGKDFIVNRASYLRGEGQCCSRICLNSYGSARCLRNRPGNEDRSIYSKTRLYQTWQSTKRRCKLGPKSKSYKYYGARGITVCEEWKNDYLTFMEWALKTGYSDNLTIDRIDNSLGYFPENCRWATKKEQSRNRAHAKLGKDIDMIKHLKSRGFTTRQLAQVCHVTKSAIQSLISGRNWQ